MYLVDTNVISAAAPSRPAPSALVEWMDTHSASLFISAVTVAEIDDSIAKTRREGATRKSADLAEWLETVLHLYGDRILAFDAATARIAGRSTWRSLPFAVHLIEMVLPRSLIFEPGFAATSTSVMLLVFGFASRMT